MSDSNIKDLVEEQLMLAAQFTKMNFGLKCGHDYPEMARAILASEKFCNDLMLEFVASTMKAGNLSLSIAENFGKPTVIVSENPFLYEQALKYLYFGIQIGRHQEEQVAAALQSIAKGEVQ